MAVARHVKLVLKTGQPSAYSSEWEKMGDAILFSRQVVVMLGLGRLIYRVFKIRRGLRVLSMDCDSLLNKFLLDKGEPLADMPAPA